MFEKHKAKKAAKRKFEQLQVQSQEAEPEKQDSGGNADSQVRYARYMELSRMMSFWGDMRQNIGWTVVGAILIAIEYLLVGIDYTLPTLVIMGLIIRTYTRRFYKVPMQYILLINIQENRPTFIGFFGFPYKVFNLVDVEGVENMIRTPNYGPVYLAREIEFEGSIPVKIKFSYIHFPEFDFVTKRETYPIMVEYLNRLVVLDTKLRETLDLNVAALSADMTQQRLKRISQGKTEDAFSLNRERDNLLKEITELFAQNNLSEKELRNRDPTDEAVAELNSGGTEYDQNGY